MVLPEPCAPFTPTRIGPPWVACRATSHSRTGSYNVDQASRALSGNPCSSRSSKKRVALGDIFSASLAIFRLRSANGPLGIRMLER